MFLTIHPDLVFYSQLKSPQILYQSELHTLRNPMMYTSHRFESEEAARSQVEPLQNDQLWLYFWLYVYDLRSEGVGAWRICNPRSSSQLTGSLQQLNNLCLKLFSRSPLIYLKGRDYVVPLACFLIIAGFNQRHFISSSFAIYFLEV